MIFTSLSPNTEPNDVGLAIRTIFSPRLWLQGKAIVAVEDFFKQYLPVKYVFTFASGRTGLYAILSALNLRNSDEVLLQAYTCVAVPDPILWVGAKPVYVDCTDHFTMSVVDLQKKITPQSKVIIIQHTFGQPADIEPIVALARQHHLIVIEDCCHALGSTYKNKPVGTFGDVSFFSFGRDKMFSAVFGGVVTINDLGLADKISKFHHQLPYPKQSWIVQQLMHPIILTLAKATYTWFGFGKMILEIAKRCGLISKAVYPIEKQGGQPDCIAKKFPNALAILAAHQLSKLERYNSHRKTITKIYQQEFAQPHYDSDTIYLRYTIVTPKAKVIRQALLRQGMELGNWYDAPIAPDGVNYAKLMYVSGSCPTAEKLAQQSLNLPTHIGITQQQAEVIVHLVKHYL